LHSCVLHQPPHRAPIRGKLGGDIHQQPLPLDEPILQVGPHFWEASAATRAAIRSSA
jgi:hypothetical protein